jgi:AraC-like DNA-binding protein
MNEHDSNLQSATAEHASKRALTSYLTAWCMTTAARLLRETSDPVGRIARRVGYTSEYAFSRAFSRQYGQPPGRYRRLARAA